MRVPVEVDRGPRHEPGRPAAGPCVDRAADLAGLPRRPCSTQRLPIHGHHPDPAALGDLAVYGSDAGAVTQLLTQTPALAARLHPALPYREAEVVSAARAEMARTVADVLARRTRALVLNAHAAAARGPADRRADGPRTRPRCRSAPAGRSATR